MPPADRADEYRRAEAVKGLAAGHVDRPLPGDELTGPAVSHESLALDPGRHDSAWDTPSGGESHPEPHARATAPAELEESSPRPTL